MSTTRSAARRPTCRTTVRPPARDTARRATLVRLLARDAGRVPETFHVRFDRRPGVGGDIAVHGSAAEAAREAFGGPVPRVVVVTAQNGVASLWGRESRTQVADALAAALWQVPNVCHIYDLDDARRLALQTQIRLA